MPQHSAPVAVRNQFAEGGPVRGIRVRTRQGDAAPVAQLPLAMAIAGLVGVVVGVVGANPSLIAGWLS